MRKFILIMGLLIPMAIAAQQINQYEYWIDSDYSTCTTINIVPVTDATVSFQYNAASLNNGIHTLNIRFKDSNNKWSTAQTDYFYKTTTTGGTNNITSYEYWFDNMFDTRTTENASSPSADVNITKKLDVSTLSNGVHTLNIRIKDATGQWSTVQTDYFYKTTSVAGANNIVSYEYWFDDMFDTRAIESISTPNIDISLLKNIDISALAANTFHTINIRFQDGTGQWSAVQTDKFKYCTEQYEAPVISGNTVVSSGQKLQLSALSSDIETTIYKWSGPNNFAYTGADISVSSMDVNKTGTYTCVAIKGTSVCDTSLIASVNVSIAVLPSAAGNISGTTPVCQGQTSVTYTVPAISNATSYAWTLPVGASGTSTTNSITVDFGIAAKNGNITVKGVNENGSGTASNKSIVVNAKPTAPVIVQNGSLLLSDIQTGNQWYDQSGIITNQTNQFYAVTNDGNYYAKVIVSGCTSDASNIITIGTITGLNDLNPMDDFSSVTAYPNPATSMLAVDNMDKNVMKKITISSLQGVVLYQTQTLETTCSIPTEKYIAGVYILHIVSENKTIVTRFVKK